MDETLNSEQWRHVFYDKGPWTWGLVLRVPTGRGKMRVHLENLEIWNFEKFNKYHGKVSWNLEKLKFPSWLYIDFEVRLCNLRLFFIKKNVKPCFAWLKYYLQICQVWQLTKNSIAILGNCLYEEFQQVCGCMGCIRIHFLWEHDVSSKFVKLTMRNKFSWAVTVKERGHDFISFLLNNKDLYF